MSTAARPVSRFNQDVDPLLLAPARLFIVSLLIEMQWCEFGFIRDTLAVTPAAVSNQLAILRTAGIVETERSGRRTWVRLTPTGSRRMVNHLEALRAMVFRAAELITSGAAACDGPPRSDQL